LIHQNILALKEISYTLKPSWTIQGWSDISGIATAVSAIATMVLAWLTQNMVNEMRDTREEESRPYIVTYIEFQHDRIYFICKNIGKTMATNVTIKFNKPLYDMAGLKLGETLFKKPIKSMPPSYEIKTYIGNEINIIPKNIGLFEISITYTNSKNEQYEEEYKVDFEDFIGMRFTESSEDKIEKHLKEIANKLNN